MAEGRDQQCWSHTSSVLATIANALCRGKGKPPFEPRDFNPYLRRHERRGPPLSKEETQAVLRALFIGKKDKPARRALPGPTITMKKGTTQHG